MAPVSVDVAVVEGRAYTEQVAQHALQERMQLLRMLALDLAKLPRGGLRGWQELSKSGVEGPVPRTYQSGCLGWPLGQE